MTVIELIAELLRMGVKGDAKVLKYELDSIVPVEGFELSDLNGEQEITFTP